MGPNSSPLSTDSRARHFNATSATCFLIRLRIKVVAAALEPIDGAILRFRPNLSSLPSL
ncbi:hypothetical protein EMEDMD4_920009 [Sinorhizobium medicae]|uniref:Uncharacterized protein n=1 Tax=Sinorhizobium medicae TaxID=110321 RepID=A0A508X833_9HYPH|nr:hypothetical protein EMEDMD4_920009 [Sinorhizobium medicae]